MHEIQDLTLNLSRGTERIQKKLKKRSKNFSKKFEGLGNPSCAWGIRMTAIPTEESILFGEVYSNGGVVHQYMPDIHTITYQEENAIAPSHWNLKKSNTWHPKLRATIQNSESNEDSESKVHYNKCYREIHCDGLIENGFLASYNKSDYRLQGLPPQFCLWIWLINLFTHHLIWVDKTRRAANSMNSEYAVDVEIDIIGDNLRVYRNEQEMNEPIPRKELEPQRLKFPTYRYNSRSQTKDLVCLFIKDFMNAAGSDISINSSEIEISDFEEI